MPKDIRIYPSQSAILFTGSSNTVEAQITLDNLGRLNLSGSDILFGPGKNDIYVGDGIASANIIYDVDGAIKGADGLNVGVTLGSKNTRVFVTGSSVNISGSDIKIGPFSSSFASIRSGSITASVQFTDPVINITTASVGLVTSSKIQTSDITSSNLTLNTNATLYFNSIFSPTNGLPSSGSVNTSSLNPGIGSRVGDAFRIISGSSTFTFIAAASGALPPDTSSAGIYYFATGSYVTESIGRRASGSVSTSSFSVGWGETISDTVRISSGSTTWLFITSDTIPPDSGNNYYFSTGSATTSSYALLSLKMNSILTGSLLSSSFVSPNFTISASFTGSRYNIVNFESSSGAGYTTILNIGGGKDYTGSINVSAFPILSTKINTILTASLLSSSVSESFFVVSSSFTGSQYNNILFQSGSGSTFTTVLTTANGKNFSSSFIDKGASISVDTVGNLTLNSVSGSIYLSKDQNNIYIGDGTSSADIVYDVDGAIRGEVGKNIRVTLGSNQTRVNITGSNIAMSAYTASSALIQGGIISASAITSSGNVTVGSLNVSSSISASSITLTSASVGFVTASIINVNNGGGIFLTGSTSTTGASIKLDNLGNLLVSAISGNVYFGKNSNDIYLGDGSSSANLIYDFNGTIKGTPGTTLTVGSSSANLLFTGSNINFQPGGGTAYFSGSTIFALASSSAFTGSFRGNATGSFSGSFTGDGSGITGIVLTSSISSGSFTGSFSGSFVGTGSIRLTSGSTNFALDSNFNLFNFTSGSTPIFLAQQVGLLNTSNFAFGFGTSTPVSASVGSSFDMRGTAIIGNSVGNNFNENLRLPSASNGATSIVMGGPATGSGTQPGVWALAVAAASTGSYFKINHNNIDIITINTASLFTINSVSGAIIQPTSSGQPTFSGSDGQFVFGNSGGNQFVFVWMAGRWRSSSLA
jgi:hypothetical protein